MIRIFVHFCKHQNFYTVNAHFSLVTHIPDLWAFVMNGLQPIGSSQTTSTFFYTERTSFSWSNTVHWQASTIWCTAAAWFPATLYLILPILDQRTSKECFGRFRTRLMWSTLSTWSITHNPQTLSSLLNTKQQHIPTNFTGYTHCGNLKSFCDISFMLASAKKTVPLHSKNIP